MTMSLQLTKTTLTYGFIYALVSLIWISLEFALGIQTSYPELHTVVSILFLVPAMYILSRGMKSHRQILHDNQSSYGYFMAFMSGFNIMIIATLLSPAVNLVFHNFVNPEFFESMIQQAVSTMAMTEDMAREFFSMKSYIQQSLVSGITLGAIMSAILAIFLRDRS